MSNALWKRIVDDGLSTGRFNVGRSLIIAIFNPENTYGSSRTAKQQIVNAVTNYVTDISYASNVRTIYLAGSSRGGALVSQVGWNLKSSPTHSGRGLTAAQLNCVSATAGSGGY